MAEKRRKSRNLEVFAIGFDIEPALFSVLDDMVDGLGLPRYFCVARLFVARKKADFTVLEEVGKTVGAKKIESLSMGRSVSPVMFTMG